MDRREVVQQQIIVALILGLAASMAEAQTPGPSQRPRLPMELLAVYPGGLPPGR